MITNHLFKSGDYKSPPATANFGAYPKKRGDDRTVVLKIIDTMLTKKKFKDFFQKNVAAL